VIRAVFFDAGHTLIHAVPSIGQVYSDVTREMGVTLPPERFASLLGPLFRRHMPSGGESSDALDVAMWRAVTRAMHAALPEMASVDVERWFAGLYERFGRGDAWAMYEDVPPALAELRARGLKLGIISNWDTRLRRIVREVGLADRVDFTKISAEVGRRKPDARIFEAALEEAGVRPQEALHVGDLVEEDVVGAAGAGIRPVLILRHDGVMGTDRPAPCAVIRGLGELAGLLR
jgi:putative hydrolase of the HAD superfamily